jgi:hypothetical protein
MNTSKDTQQEIKDKELVEFATKFLEAYAASAENRAAGATLEKGHPYALGAGGIIELTEDIISAQSGFVHRAAKLLKSKAAHEKAISNIATNHAQQFLAGKENVQTAASDLIEEIFEKGNSSFEYLAPNYAIRFNAPIRGIKIGRVRALLTEDFSTEWKSSYPAHRVNIVSGEGFSLQLGREVIITIRPICWIVDVDAVAENVEEEGKWLIDVALSFLRLTHPKWSGHFPELGAVEPHPLKSTRLSNEGVKLQGSNVLAGGSSVPPWYEIPSHHD